MANVPTYEEFKALSDEVMALRKEVTALRSLPPGPEWLTVEQAAKELNLCEQTVRSIARKGLLSYKKGKHKMEIQTASVRKYITDHMIAA